MFQELGAGFTGEGGVFWMLVAIQLWELPWKGAALWRAAHNKHLGWFVALMLVHLAGLIDIIYLFYFSESKKRVATPRTRKTTKNVK
jgi:hypothetical protein